MIHILLNIFLIIYILIYKKLYVNYKQNLVDYRLKLIMGTWFFKKGKEKMKSEN